MDKNKLVFKLERFSNILVFEVLDQCPSITNRVEGKSLKFVASNDIEIRSSYSVLVNEDNICIGGFREKIGADVIVFDTPKEAEEIKQDFLYALAEWAKNDYFNLGRASDKLVPDEEGIYRI